LRKSEFETMLTVGIAAHRLALIRDPKDRNLLYSNEMHDPEDSKKIYLLEFYEDYFILRSDVIFDESVKRFFYVTREKFEYNEGNLKHALLILRKVEHKVYDIMAKLHLRGYYTKKEFIRRLIELVPQLELHEDTVRDRKNMKTYITVKEEFLHFVYKDAPTESYMDLAKKDFNETILQQCIELITVSLKMTGA